MFLIMARTLSLEPNRLPPTLLLKSWITLSEAIVNGLTCVIAIPLRCTKTFDARAAGRTETLIAFNHAILEVVTVAVVATPIREEAGSMNGDHLVGTVAMTDGVR
jgi:hypothetical protein